ncbi:GTPase [Cellulomonas alba]|uniref:50S ribosome-binding GTPase n=1 Tax=Cellulomonas alba TaxID=3053467 RepID=A0ABT7SC75_9CELL|nr:GTPase [Cellulomonas alba]MDM7853669.1 50S ribosome-binding GTPase [Cellulomonas alba]
MTVNLFKESSARARGLAEELRNVLAEFDPALAEPLLERLSVEAHATPLLVFTGYHSSGKSTLIEALTNRAFHIPIGSGVTTDQVTEYSWDGDVRLVDTPGVHADRPDHDERAEQALQAADLVLFAVPVELFDDTLVAHLRDVLGRLGKSHQTLIVITKAGTMEAAPGHREAAITEALGSFEQVPWVECDAQYYLDGLDLADSAPADSSAFVEASGLAKVAALINDFARQQGELGRLSQPLQMIAAISLEASASLTDDPNEQAALTVLGRQRSALSKKRIHLGELLGARSAQFRSDAVRAATQFADAIERDEHGGDLSGTTLESRMATLNESLGTALERFESSVKRVLEIQFDDLASEVLAIEATPYGRLTLELADVETAGFDAPEVVVRPSHAAVPTAPGWTRDMSKYLKQFNKFWGAGGGVRPSAGSNGHQVVLTVGRAFGKKFKPWQAVRTANTIGKVARVGGVVIAVGLEAYGVLADERAAVKAEQARAERRRSITQEVLAQAATIVAEALENFGKDLDDIFKPEFERIDAMAGEIYGARATRNDLRDRLSSVQKRAGTALAALAAAAGSSAPGPDRRRGNEMTP